MAKKKRQANLSFPKLSVSDGTKAYMELKKEVAKAGILKRSYGYYTILLIAIAASFFFSLYQIIITSNFLHLVMWSFLFGFFAVQVAGFLHDAGHRAIFNSVKNNDFFGHIFGAILATDFTSWKYRHNLHHSHPNEEKVDPDLIELPFLSFTKSHFQSKNKFWKNISAYQVYFYYPLFLLYNFGLRLYGIDYYSKRLSFKNLWTAAIYSIATFTWFVLPFLVFPLTKAILVFAVINGTMSIYLLNIIAPNHKAMPKFAKDIHLSFLDRQILTSSNIYGNWLYDFLYMGLNYQIEHHLFPNCPRNKLSQIAPLVKQLCKRRRLEYTEVGIIQANKNILSELKHIAATSTS